MAFPDGMKKGNSIDPRLNTEVPPGGDGGDQGGGEGTDDHVMSVRLLKISHEPWSARHGRNQSGGGGRNPQASPHVKTNRSFYN